MATRKKKVLEKQHGSFNLEGLMVKSKAKRVVLNQEDNIAAQKQQADDQRTRKVRDDLLQFKLCAHMCKCETNACKWQHHSLCPEEIVKD